MRKQITAFVITVALILCILPLSAFAESGGVLDVSDERTVISGYRRTEKTVPVPPPPEYPDTGDRAAIMPYIVISSMMAVVLCRIIMGNKKQKQ